jgi:type II secretion system protein G
MKKMRRQGFTLIELMIVISIIGVLAAIAIPNFRQARDKSNKRACYANQKTILGALEMYNLDNGTAATISGDGSVLSELATLKYLQSVPEDPGCKGAKNYRSDAVGNMWCEMHGSIDGVPIGGPGSELDDTKAKGSGTCQGG